MAELKQNGGKRRRNASLALLFAGLAMGVTLPSLAQYHDLDPKLAAAAKEYDHAQIVGDAAALDQLVADDYLILRANGTLGDKKLLIEIVTGTGIKNDPYVVEKPFQRIYGNTVILGGWVRATGTDHGKPYIENARFADTWTKRNGVWKVVFTAVSLTDHK